MTFPRNAEIYGESEPADYVYKVVSGGANLQFSRPAPVRRLPFSGEVFGLQLGVHQQFSAKAIDKCVILVLKQNALVALADDDSSTALPALVTKPSSSIVEPVLAAAKNRKSTCAAPTAH
jgi:CRP/FNR family transcriptional regulator, nitrogen fixation regulation protein